MRPLIVAALVLLTGPAFAQNIPTSGNVEGPKGAIGLCSKYEWACSNFSGHALSLEEVDSINRQINKIKPVSDMNLYGVEEKWKLPSTRGADCEDYALAKKKALIDAGADPRKLMIATVLDRKRNPHAVLVWRTSSGDLVLDNLTNEIRKWNDTGYFWIFIQSPDDLTKWKKVFKTG